MSASTSDADIATQMLSVLTQVDSTISPPTAVSLDEQKRYMRKNIDVIDVEGRKSIGNIIINNGSRSDLVECAEGTVINLDKLPATTIEQMYLLLLYLMEKRG